jgi:ABC-type antimicrobial peptide transport system permease subunit
MVAVSFILYIAVAILILNAMLMAVFERVREFGVLKALGVEPRTVVALIAIESAIQTGIAIAVGLLLATPGLLYLERVGVDIASLAGISVMGIAMDPIWRAAITPSVFMIPIGMLVAIVSIAVVYPALKAALIRPVEAMRYH